MALDTLSKAIGDIIDLSPGDIIAKFGGDKKAIGLAAMKGEVDPTKAVMAGMAIDRIAASAMEPADTTVAEDIFSMQGFSDPTMPQQGLMAAAPQPPRQPQMGRPAPQQPGQGLNQVPVPQRGFAEGGVVGFQGGGSFLQKLFGSNIDPRLPALLQKNPGMTVAQAAKVLGIPLATLTTGLAATDALMSTDKGGLTDIAPTPGYDYGAERMAGGRPEIPTGTTGTREAPGFMDYLAEKIMPRKQVMDPKTGKYVDVAPTPFPTSASPGLAGALDGQGVSADVEKRIAEAQAGRGPDVERPEAPLDKTLGVTEEGDLVDIVRPGYKEPQGEKEPSEQDKALADLNERAQKARNELAQLYGDDKAPKIVTEEEALSASRDLFKAAGVDFDLYKKQAEELAAEKEQLKGDRKEAMNLRLIEAGLGILGGESPYAFVNIGKGATPALQNLAKDIRQIKQDERALNAAKRALAVAQNQMSMGLGKDAADRVAKAQERVDKFTTEKNNHILGMSKLMIEVASREKVAGMNLAAARELSAGQYGSLQRQNQTAARDAIADLQFTSKYKKASPEEQKAMENAIYREYKIDPATGEYIGPGATRLNTSALTTSKGVLDFATGQPLR
jgi:hypothetical protein